MWIDLDGWGWRRARHRRLRLAGWLVLRRWRSGSGSGCVLYEMGLGIKHRGALPAAHPTVRYFELVSHHPKQGATGGAAGDETHGTVL